MFSIRLGLSAAMLTSFTGLAVAGQADVVDARFEQASDGTYAFHVTVRHDDAGWDHYADKWQVVSEDGSIVYGERILLHPHENEQPFTRSQSGIDIPDDIEAVIVRAHDKVHGWGGAEMRIPLKGVF